MKNLLVLFALFVFLPQLHAQSKLNLSIRVIDNQSKAEILEDSAESITLRTTGLWPYSNIGPNQSVTVHLTRIGP